MNETNFMFHLSSVLIAGVLEEKAIREVLDDEYFSSITEEMNNTWKKDHDGKSVKESLDDYLVEYIGKPITQLFRYKSQLLHHWHALFPAMSEDAPEYKPLQGWFFLIKEAPEELNVHLFIEREKT